MTQNYFTYDVSHKKSAVPQHNFFFKPWVSHNVINSFKSLLFILCIALSFNVYFCDIYFSQLYDFIIVILDQQKPRVIKSMAFELSFTDCKVR